TETHTNPRACRVVSDLAAHRSARLSCWRWRCGFRSVGGPAGVVPELPAVGAIRLVFYRVSCPLGLLGCGSEEVLQHDPPESGVPAPTLTTRVIEGGNGEGGDRCRSA